MKQAGIMPEQYISARLGLPFMGYSCMAIFTVGKGHSSNRTFTCYFHHNRGGGRSMGGKINGALRLRDIAPCMDATFSGHFHTTSRTPVVWYDVGFRQARKRTGYDYIIGSALTWNQSYAEQKAFPAASIEHIKVTFVPGNGHDIDSRHQIYEVITK